MHLKYLWFLRNHARATIGMRYGIGRSALANVPYLDLSRLGDRIVNLMPFWDGTEWHTWFPVRNGLEHMKPVNVVSSDYVAKTAADENDVWIPFVEFMWQRASWPETRAAISGISADFHNFATSAAKLEHYFKARGDIGMGTSHFVATEMEYLFTTSRSVFDLLHLAVSSIWRTRIKLIDLDAEKYKRQLPNRLSSFLLKDDKSVRSAEEMCKKCRLPGSLASAYVSMAPFFQKVRCFRDGVIHGGKNPSTIFVTEKGFCIRGDSPEFQLFDIWKNEHWENQDLVSLKPLISYLVTQTIVICDGLIDAFARNICFPEEIAPGYKIFVRGFHNGALTRLIRNGPWWG